ncbi:hypothetical protein ACKVMT_03800 [Halobacteriales archaeon Cl-PHB]
MLGVATGTGLTDPLASVVLASENEAELFFYLLVGFGAGLLAIYWGWNRYERYSLIRNTPTSKVRSMAVGRTELHGTATPVDAPLGAPFSNEPCLYADWSVEEYRHDPNDDGKDWQTIAQGELATPFFLEDGTGRVLVHASEDTDFDLSDANETTVTATGRRDTPAVITEFVETARTGTGDSDWGLDDLAANPLDTIRATFEGDGRIGHSSNRRRYRQNVLPVESAVYVLGYARSRDVTEVPDRVAGANEDLLVVERDTSTDLFLVSDRTEAGLTDYYSTMAPVAIGGGLLVSTASLYFLLSWYLLA